MNRRMRIAFFALVCVPLSLGPAARAQSPAKSPEAAVTGGESALSGALEDVLALLGKEAAPQCRQAAKDPKEIQKCMVKCREKMSLCSEACRKKPTDNARRACIKQCSSVYMVCVYRCR